MCAAWSDATLCAVNTWQLHASRRLGAHGSAFLFANCTRFVGNKLHRIDNEGGRSARRYIGPGPPALTSNIVHLNTGRYSPKSRNCFMERGDGENFEKCSMCLGTLANAAFFMINLTNFIVDAERPGSGKQPRRPIDSAPQSGPAFPSQPPFGNRWEASTGEERAATNRRQGAFIYLTPRPIGHAMGETSDV